MDQINAAEISLDAGEEGGHLGLVSDIRNFCNCGGIYLRKIGNRVRVDVADRHLRTFGEEALGDGAANAACACCYDRVQS